MNKLGPCQYAVLVPLCKEAFANKEFTTTTTVYYARGIMFMAHYDRGGLQNHVIDRPPRYDRIVVVTAQCGLVS